MLNDRSSALALLETRRSGRPRHLVAPGPTAAELARIVTIAARIPDHGKLHPWRFVHVPAAARPRFQKLLEQAALSDGRSQERPEADAIARFATQAPELLVVLSAPAPSPKIPLWEQQLSCGAACMNLLHAAHALGYAGGWITGWAAYSENVRQAFARGGEERIAGFMFLGTPAFPLEERPRPALETIWSAWPDARTNRLTP